MRAAVVGAGLAGIAAAWNLVEIGFEVFLFDPKGIGGGASGVSTGLLHPFPGKRAERSWRADEGMEETKKLLLTAEKALGKLAADRSGIFRPAITVEQKIDFQNNKDEAAKWTQISLPDCPEMEGLWIASGITVFSRLYLKGLWLACEQRGAVLRKENFTSPDAFDKVVWAVGADIIHLEEGKKLSLRTAIGQSLLCRWKKPLLFSLASQGYITLTEDPTLCQVGSTYEHTRERDPQKAIELLEKVSKFYPPAKDFEIVEVRHGTRVAPKEGHQPILQKINEKTWIFTGLGSRGMLYHALMAKELVLSIQTQFPQQKPP